MNIFEKVWFVYGDVAFATLEGEQDFNFAVFIEILFVDSKSSKGLLAHYSNSWCLLTIINFIECGAFSA